MVGDILLMLTFVLMYAVVVYFFLTSGDKICVIFGIILALSLIGVIFCSVDEATYETTDTTIQETHIDSKTTVIYEDDKMVILDMPDGTRVINKTQ